MAGSYDREALRALLAARTFKRGEFLLVSGKRSRIYFNMKATMMTPEGAAQCARGLLSVLDGLEADYVAGLEMGAVPLLGGIAAASWDAGRPIGAVFVRKAAKAHGTSLMVEGLDDAGGETLAGKTVVLIDDVATSGGSILKAADQFAKTSGKHSTRTGACNRSAAEESAQQATQPTADTGVWYRGS